MKTNLANFYFRSVCIKPVVLRMNLYREVALSFSGVASLEIWGGPKNFW